MTIKKHVYGWKRDLPDFRDFKFAITENIELPKEVDLRKPEHPIVDQSTLGSCTANGIATVYHAVEYIQKKPVIFYPSRLFIYYNERAMEGTINYDAGARIRDGIKSVAKQGVCDEKSWLYIISQFKKKPSVDCYKEALDHQAIQYEAVPQTLYSLKYTLSQGYPIVGGIAIYDSFESEEVTNTGIIPMPKYTESLLGGHCTAFVGYSDKNQWFIGQNSWGEKWGDKGYFYIPYNYLTNPSMASDFWVIKLLE